MFFVEEGFTYRNFLMDALAIFVLIVWFWLLITIASDLFRRHDISGWVKALWVIILILAPYLGVFIYMIFQGAGMAERNSQQPSEHAMSSGVSSASASPRRSRSSRA